MSLRNSQIIYILHLYEMSNFEYVLRFENLIFLFSAYILVNDKINIFLKDSLREFFKHSWFNSLVLRIRWRWKKSECKLLKSSGWGVKIKLHMRAVGIILFCRKCVMVKLLCCHKASIILIIGVKWQELKYNAGITTVFCIKLLVTQKFIIIPQL